MKRSGEVTIFLCGVLMLIAAVILTSWTVARDRASAVYAELVAKTSVESCFAEFYRPLWEEYRVLAFYEKEPLEEGIGSYLEAYAAQGDNFLSFREGDVRVLQATYLTEAGGLWMQESGADYMKYHVATEFLEEITQPLELVGQIRRAAGLIKEIMGFSEQVLEIEVQLRKIKVLTENLTEGIGEGLQLAKELALQIQEIKWQMEAGVSEEEAFSLLESCVGDKMCQLEPTLVRLNETWPQLIQAVETFQEQATNLNGKLTQAWELFEMGEYTGVVRTLLQEPLTHAHEYSSQGGGRYAEVLEIKSHLFADVSQLTALETVRKEMSVKETPAEAMTAVESWICSIENAGWQQPVWLTELGELKNAAELESAFDVKIWTEEALIRAVIGDQASISDRELNASDRISETLDKRGSDSDALSSLLFRAYLAEELSHFREACETHALVYEVEYLLGGHVSDRENLLAVIGDLLLLRESVNLIGYLSDPVKIQEAKAVALTAAGVTGMPALAGVLQTGILAAWAFEDAVVDVKAMMQGEKVPLLRLFGEAYFPLEYAGYLNVLLSFLQVEDLRAETLDLIQATMKRGDETFDLQKCVYHAEVSVELRGGGVVNSCFITHSFGYDS